MRTLIIIAVLGLSTEAAACSLCGSGGAPGDGLGPVSLVPSYGLRYTASALGLAGAAALGTAALYSFKDGKLVGGWRGISLAIGIANLAAACIIAITVSRTDEPAKWWLVGAQASSALYAMAVPITGWAISY